MEKIIQNIHIIINPASGKEEPILSTINIAMKEVGIKWEALVTHKEGDAIRYAQDAVKKGVDAVAVYGGDGAVMEVVSGLIGSEIPLIILPGGSTNVMAKELGIPEDLKESCAIISQVPRKIKTIDVGQFGNRYFITGLSIGFGADLVKGAGRKAKNKYGILAYLFSAVEAFNRIRLVNYHLNIDGNKFDVQGMTCVIANAGNVGFTDVSLDRNIDVSDGLLDVVVLRKANLFFLKHIITALIKREMPVNLELVKHWQGKQISVSTNHKQVVQCDGEVLENIPAQIKVVPAAITVLIPDRSKTNEE